MNIKERNLAFVRAILSRKAFYDVFSLFIKELKMPLKSENVEVMKSMKLHREYGGDTYERRATTVSAWINWVLNLAR